MHLKTLIEGCRSGHGNDLIKTSFPIRDQGTARCRILEISLGLIVYNFNQNFKDINHAVERFLRSCSVGFLFCVFVFTFVSFPKAQAADQDAIQILLEAEASARHVLGSKQFKELNEAFDKAKG